jgi:hypothetical protein
LITNVTSNQVIYNFSDANLKATSYSIATDASNNTTTTVILNYDTSGMAASDKIQVIVDEFEESFKPAETFQDPVNKFRVSQPQALIDTDFEYGTQPTKWENLSLTNGRPFAYFTYGGSNIPNINYITVPKDSKIITVGLAGVAPPVGTPINVQDTILNIANGNFIVETVSGVGNTIFTYTGKGANSSTTISSINDANKTGIYTGSLYTGAAIGASPTSVVGFYTGIAAGIAVTITTSVAHGLTVGNEIAIIGLGLSNGASGVGTPNGNYTVAQVSGAQTFTYYSPTIPNASIVSAGASIFVRPQSQFLHRPYDGGVIFSSEAASANQSTIRQTRRYFRYQSGKGIQVSSGTILKPSYQIESLTASGTGVGSTITVNTKEQHNLMAAVYGTTVQVFGANQNEYNGTYDVNNVTGPNSFTYLATSGLTTTAASGSYQVSVSSWSGGAIRLGIFDQQNGLFFEFDGTTLSAVRRSSTYQLAGRVSVTTGSHTVSRSDSSFQTAFSKQLIPGDRIVIRGQSYRVLEIQDDNTLAIIPAYRGPSITFANISKTIDLKIPQSQWNLDKCDGTGPSGFNLNLTKMQMFYIDYSWYGAGFVRWGFRATNGDVIYCHKLANNNFNTEAYMRSGNLPARYETMTEAPYTTITSTLSSTDTYVGVASTAGFPSQGTLLIRPSDAGNYEYVNYTGIGTTAFTGLTRAKSGVSTSITLSGIVTGSNVATGSTTNLQVGMRIFGTSIPDRTFIGSLGIGTIFMTQSATGIGTSVSIAPMGATTPQIFTYSATRPRLVELSYPTFSPTVSHWGTSAIMDGRYDDDKSLIFTYGQVGLTTVQATTNNTRALMAIRVAPSVDNGVPGAFGTRELINRMQLILRQLDITGRPASGTTINVLIQAYLNATPSTPVAWTNAVRNVAYVPNSSLAQIADYAATGTAAAPVTVNGGEVTAGFFVGSGVNSIDLSQVRDLGNSINGGGDGATNRGIYPDGPDTLTIVATNLASTNVELYTRLSWTEAQA